MADFQTAQPANARTVLFERHGFSRMFSTASAEEINSALRRLSQGEAFKALDFMNAGGDTFLFQHPEKTSLVVPVLLEAIGLDIAHAEKNNQKIALSLALNGIRSMEERQQSRVRDRKARTIPYSEIKRLIGKAQSAIFSLQSFQADAFPARPKTGAQPKTEGKTAKI